MGNLTPVQRLKESLSKLILAMPEGRDAEYQDVRPAYLEVEGVFNSPEFRRYRESFGKLSLMARSQARSEDCGFDNFKQFLDYWDTISQSITCHGQVRFVDVAGLYTRLQVMELDQECIDGVFSRQES